MIKVLFICHGNICRSPMAEFIFKDKVEKAGLQDCFEIGSAATSSEETWGGGSPIYPPAKAELRKHGIGNTAYTDFSGKRARQVTKADYEHYDFLLCAETYNIQNAMRITGPDTEHKIRLMLDYAKNPARHGQNISDPWFSDRFEETYRDIDEAMEGLLETLR